jgi:dolichol-phosphate mannosyltransferase
VFGRKPHRSHGLIKRLTSRIFTRVLSLLADKHYDNAVTHFSIVSKAVVTQIRRFKEHNRSYAYFVGWLGYRVGFVEVEHHPRFAGSGSYTPGRLFALAFEIIVSQSEKPLKASIVLGLLVAGAALFGAGYDIWHYLHSGIPVQGWTSLIVSIYFLGGLQLIALGVLGLYIGRIFEETKGRPLYIVKDLVNFAPPRLK